MNFQKSGPTKQQMEESFFEYFFYGRGWEPGENVDEINPTKKVLCDHFSYYYFSFFLALAICRGPDLGYIGTSGCVASSALALLEDKDTLPKQLVKIYLSLSFIVR